MTSDELEGPRIFGTRRAAKALALEISRARSDGVLAYVVELTARDDRPVSGAREPQWIIELELAGVVLGRLCRDGLVRLAP